MGSNEYRNEFGKYRLFDGTEPDETQQRLDFLGKIQPAWQELLAEAGIEVEFILIGSVGHSTAQRQSDIDLRVKPSAACANNPQTMHVVQQTLMEVLKKRQEQGLSNYHIDLHGPAENPLLNPVLMYQLEKKNRRP